MDSHLLDQIRHLCRDRAAYEHLKAILVQQERVHQLSWEEHYEKLLASQSSDSPASNLLSNIIAREKALAQLADTIQRSPSLELVLQVAVQVAQKLLQVDRVAIFRFHDDGRGEFATDAIASGVESFANMPERQLSLARHLAESIQAESEGHIAEQEEQIVANIRSSSISNHISNLLEEIGISAYASNKIHAGQEVWGTLVAFYGNNHQSCSESDRTSLSLIAAQIGIAISLTNLRQQSHDLTEDLQVLKNELDHLHRAVAEIAASDNQSVQNLVVNQDIDADEPTILQEPTVETITSIEAPETISIHDIEQETEAEESAKVSSISQVPEPEIAPQDIENVVIEVPIEVSHPDQETVLIESQITEFNHEQEVPEESPLEIDSHQQETHPLANIDSDFHEALAALPTETSSLVLAVADIEKTSIPLVDEDLTLSSRTIDVDTTSVMPVAADENITSVDLAMNFEQADAPATRTIPTAEIQSLTDVEGVLVEDSSKEAALEISIDHFNLVELQHGLDTTESCQQEQQYDLPVTEPTIEQVHRLPIDLCAFLEQETNPVIDLQFLETLTNCDRNLALEVIDTYLQETPLLVQAIDQALATNNHTQLWELLNKLRSSSGKVGALTLVYQCRQLESSIKANYVVLIYACLARVAIESQKAIESLRILRSQYT
ncbi:GAF domain-containing protein [Pseudanabaena mucicola]|uniref:GAF domain-containing protein n=1 Tax=Pseudanabaena mucicola FACHB-723 TaxID=2692860 RepID=A0ABR7ZSL7_9CYAN|nr:GAF domain-containing protein [Pseudanabaena mucicola]MBD2186964.1 GAF domain-containing protein [Pseudanabaena mucicola FACHB-723]